MRSKTMNIFAILLATLCQSFKYLSADNHAALVFDRYNSSLYEISPEIKPDTPCGSWASACPAKNEADETFITETAITKNALFVEEICEKEQTVEQVEFKTDICKKPFQISVLFNKTNVSFEFGYEVYYKDKNVDLFHTHYRLRHYVNPVRIFGSIKEKSKLTLMFFQEVIKLMLMEQKIHWHNENRKLRFMWISLFKIEFDFFKWTPIKIVYQIRNNNKWPVAFSCERYDLLSEAYEDVDLDSLYSADNQSKIFSNLELPEESSSAFCTSNCLEKWLLIPIDQFHFGTLDYTLCSNMATVPIWSSTIRKVLVRVEKFLYALHQKSGAGLHISSGVSGNLQLAKKKRRWWRKNKISKKTVYLDTKGKKIPVPEILYKVVKYKPKHCPKRRVCVYSATIVIHNDPNFNSPTDKICEDMTSLWAWIDLKADLDPNPEETPEPSPYIYVCKTDINLLIKLMGASVIGEPLAMKDLNLNEFPVYDKEKNFSTKLMFRQLRFALSTLNRREKELRREHGIEEGHERARRALQSLFTGMEKESERLKPMDSIVEDDEEDTDGIETEDPAQNDTIEESRGNHDADAVIVSPVVEGVIQQIRDESRGNDDLDTLGDEVQTSLIRNAAAQGLPLQTAPESESDEESVNEDEESENDEVPDLKVRRRSLHEEDSNAKMGSEDEGSSLGKNVKAGTASSNLEEQSSPRKSQSLHEEEIDKANDSKYEKNSSPESGTKDTASSDVKEQSSPRK